VSQFLLAELIGPLLLHPRRDTLMKTWWGRRGQNLLHDMLFGVMPQAMWARLSSGVQNAPMLNARGQLERGKLFADAGWHSLKAGKAVMP
jgi:hypothetical protein